MRRASEIARAGATVLLKEGLRLESGESLLIIYQNDRADLAQHIRQRAEELRIRVIERSYARESFLGPHPDTIHVEQMQPLPAAIVLLIELSPQTTAARMALLKGLAATGHRWRIASMPGATLHDMRYCLTDLPVLTSICRQIFAVMARGESAVLLTPGPDHCQDRLDIPLERYIPIASTGAIPEGHWGNFPSGETFILPDPFKAHGAVTIRGSIPGRVLEASEWIRLVIRRGRIAIPESTASSDALLHSLLTRLAWPSKRPRWRNSNAFAELGVGANRAIVKLTGKPLFDEKKLGTIHVAFGTNSQFGGPIPSPVHDDLVCTGATLQIADVTVVRNGRYVLTDSVAVPVLDKVKGRVKLHSVDRLSVSSSESVRMTAIRNDPALIVSYVSHRGTEESFRIATGETATLASRLMADLRRLRRASVNQLERGYSKSQLDRRRCRRVLEGLVYYGLVRVLRG